jgi:hypothetical protein
MLSWVSGLARCEMGRGLRRGAGTSGPLVADVTGRTKCDGLILYDEHITVAGQGAVRFMDNVPLNRQVVFGPVSLNG